jgi:hypothetical protein
MSFRPVRSFHNGNIKNSEGAGDVIGAHGKSARWCDFSGPLDGGVNLHGGIAIFDHPENRRHPSSFYVFDSSELQFLQSAFLFHEPYVLEAGQELKLSYGILVHKGLLNHDQLENAYKKFVYDRNSIL